MFRMWLDAEGINTYAQTNNSNNEMKNLGIQ